MTEGRGKSANQCEVNTGIKRNSHHPHSTSVLFGLDHQLTGFGNRFERSGTEYLPGANPSTKYP